MYAATKVFFMNVVGGVTHISHFPHSVESVSH